MDASALLGGVEAAFAETGAGKPRWANPHPGGLEPAPQEYSRESDPGKYRILGARVQAWSRALVEAGLADVEVLDGTGVRWCGPLITGLPVLEVVRLRPTRAGAVPLLLAAREDVEGLATVISVGAGDPAHEVELVPDCACDACDLGSQDLLEALDDRVLDVISGALVAVAGPGWSVHRTRDGWQARGDGGPQDFQRELAAAEAGRSSHPVVRGQPWW